MIVQYAAVCFDLFGTLTDDAGRPNEGAGEMLRALHATPWAVVTSCSRGFANSLFDGNVMPKPAVLVSADDVSRTKPSPECYLLAARLLHVDPARVLVIEDSSQGIAAARAAGMDVLAIVGSRASSYASAATYVVRGLRDFELAQGDACITLTLSSF